MTQPPDDAALVELVTITNERGSRLRCGDYLSEWEEGHHPYGQVKPCPFCRAEQDYTSLWYNGPGSPPSYAWQCGGCGAQGPTSSGRCRGDHYTAIINAREEWNKAADALEAKDRRIAEMREAIQSALQCTPHARETPSGAAVVIYDCGDPWAILRAALEPSDKGVGR